MVVPGCGQPEQPKTPPGAVPAKVAPEQTNAIEPAGKPVAESPVAKPVEPVPAKPASLQEATRAIDFRKFPMPEGESATNKAAAILSYPLRKLDGEQAMQFYRAKFAEAGWKLNDEEYVNQEKGYFRYSWTKQGFVMSGGAHKDPMGGAWSMYITNHGNIDSRTLPRIAGADVKNSAFVSTYYHTHATADAVAEFTRAELTKAGWREVEVSGGKRKLQPDEPRHVRFIQRGMAVGANISVAQGKTNVLLGVSVLRVELPIMPETNGTVEFMDAEFLPVHLFYSTPASPDRVLDFHRKELPALGWTIRAGTDTIADGKAKVILEAPEKGALQLELLALKDNATLVRITDAVEGKAAKPAPSKP
jgi:predicted enzyme related to lactoylglutathione lyase